ncbi:MAG: leucine/isoleucine/valine transporter permease subunit [Deltaproteobacteria bacterium ADurb.Bin510]|nr:MAG: leucine/isoleucine/valine transporter permease subunit [Deltaproteobacteria bacterium ADurb.Bin510]
MLALLIFTIFVVGRLRDSRIGRAWIALREDEIACQAMGIDKTKTKLTAFALGATWAGLGGMGSIIGVILAAFILILLPEYLRAFSEFRMLVFGGCMVLMMVFRPQGLISRVQKHYRFDVNQSEVQP